MNETGTSTGVTWFRDVAHFAAQTPSLHGFMVAWAVYGGLVALVLLAVLAYLLARRQPESLRGVASATWVGVAALLALAVNQGVSHAVQRARPCRGLAHVHALVSCASDFSFPSDHATIAGAIAVSLLLLRWQIGLVAAALALFLAFARVYVGAHYPGDVAAGLGLGAAVALVGYLPATRVLAALAAMLARTPLRRLVAAG